MTLRITNMFGSDKAGPGSEDENQNHYTNKGRRLEQGPLFVLAYAREGAECQYDPQCCLGPHRDPPWAIM